MKRLTRSSWINISPNPKLKKHWKISQHLSSKLFSYKLFTRYWCPSSEVEDNRISLSCSNKFQELHVKGKRISNASKILAPSPRVPRRPLSVDLSSSAETWPMAAIWLIQGQPSNPGFSILSISPNLFDPSQHSFNHFILKCTHSNTLLHM